MPGETVISAIKPGVEGVRELLAQRDTAFWPALREATRSAKDFSAVLSLATMRKKAVRAGISVATEKTIRLAIVGGSSLYPLNELLEQMIGAVSASGWWQTELWKGDYDNYISEILDPESELYAFKPEVIFLIPSSQRCVYQGAMTDSREQQQAAIVATAEDLLGLCHTAHER